MKILVSVAMDPAGLEVLRKIPDAQVDYEPDLPAQKLAERISAYHVLVAGTQTPVDREILERGEDLRLIALMGTGRTFLDLDSATRKGLLVIHAPDRVTVSVAEHAVSMMLALVRRIPEADSSIKRGAWSQDELIGREVQGKTLGIIGFGAVGTLVAGRAKGLMMNVIVYDPHLSAEAVARKGCRKVSREELFSLSDLISIHAPLNPTTRGLVGTEAIALMKPGVFLVNCSASAILDEEAVYEALARRKIGGIAMDLQKSRPIKEHPLYASERVICTPNLGAHTEEARAGCSLDLARSIETYLNEGKIVRALNLPEPEEWKSGQAMAWLDLGEVLGRFVIQLRPFGLQGVDIALAGQGWMPPAEAYTRSVLKGILSQVLSEPVNLVNARSLAEERRIRVTETRTSTAGNYQALTTVTVATEQGGAMVSGTLFDDKNPRIVRLNDFAIEVVPDGDFLVILNRDRPGVIADVGETLGRHEINIGQMHNGRDTAGGDAITVVRVDSPVTGQLLDELRDLPNVLYVTPVNLA